MTVLSNLRTLPWLQETLGLFLSEWRPFRRWVGGKWERWYVDVVHSVLWHPVTDWSDADRRPTVICRGTPTREEYP